MDPAATDASARARSIVALTSSRDLASSADCARASAASLALRSAAILAASSFRSVSDADADVAAASLDVDASPGDAPADPDAPPRLNRPMSMPSAPIAIAVRDTTCVHRSPPLFAGDAATG